MTALVDLPDLGRVLAERLAALGVRTPADLLARCPDRREQEKLATDARLNMSHLRGWLRHADLMRVSGVDRATATALIAVGTSSARALAGAIPERLATDLASLSPAPDWTAIVGNAATLDSVVELPDDVDPAGPLATVAAAVEDLARDGASLRLGDLAFALLDTASRAILAVPDRRRWKVPSSADPAGLLAEDDDALTRYLADVVTNAALVLPGDVPVAYVAALQADTLRQQVTAFPAGSASSVAPVTAPSADDLRRLAISADASFQAARSGFKATGLPPREGSGIKLVEALTADLVATVESRLATIQACLVDGRDADLEAALVATPFRLAEWMPALAELDVRAARLLDGRAEPRAAAAVARLARTRRLAVMTAAFAGRVLGELRAGLVLDAHRTRAALPFQASEPMDVGVASVRTGDAGGRPARILGLRIGDAPGRLRLADLGDPAVRIEVELPGDDPYHPLVYRPPICAIRVDPREGPTGLVQAVTATRVTTFLTHAAAFVDDVFPLFPGGADWIQSPSLPESGSLAIAPLAGSRSAK